MKRIGKGADRLDGQHGSFYLNYNNLINTPTIPSGNQIIDWTASGAGTIHASNYVDNNTTYSVGDGGLTQKNFTTALKTKLDGIATGAEVNVQSDWNASSGDAQILNKPTIPTNNNQLTNGAGYVTSSGWTSSNDGSGSGLDADYLDGYHYDSRWLNGSSGQNHYVAANYGYNWFRPVNDTGVYLNSYGAHWYRTQSSYGTWQAHGYQNGGYVGLQTYYSYQNNLMYDSGGNGGIYQQNGAGWQFYFNRGHHCLGVAGSTTNGSYELYVNGDLYATGNVVAYSDARAKENIETIGNALDKVSKIRGVYYTWKKGERGADKEEKRVNARWELLHKKYLRFAQK